MSYGPDITNIQLAFWKMAVDKYREIEQAAECDNYDWNEFFIDATITLILAGSSLTQLVGQNTASSGTKLPSPKQEMKRELGPNNPLYLEVCRFIDFYDDIRHFGESKHENVSSLDESIFVDAMAAVQSVWVYYLEKNGVPVTDDFRIDFKVTGT